MQGQNFSMKNATVRFRHNLISHLQDSMGHIFCDYKEKELILWEALKDKPGKSDFLGFPVDREHFTERSDLLKGLELNFSTVEIDNTVKAVPNNKSPGPDGFNNEILKKCWPIIKENYYSPCEAFQQNSVYLQSINSSYITLISKVDGAKRVSHFRPISLLSSSVNLITQLMANRLQAYIIDLVHKNQYVFIRTRAIQWFSMGI